MRAALAVILALGLASGCCTETTIRGDRPVWPRWADDIAAMCYKMAVRNVNYVAHAGPEATEKDRAIVESDARFYLGLVQLIDEKRAAFHAEERFCR